MPLWRSGGWAVLQRLDLNGRPTRVLARRGCACAARGPKCCGPHGGLASALPGARRSKAMRFARSLATNALHRRVRVDRPPSPHNCGEALRIDIKASAHDPLPLRRLRPVLQKPPGLRNALLCTSLSQPLLRCGLRGGSGPFGPPPPQESHSSSATTPTRSAKTGSYCGPE